MTSHLRLFLGAALALAGACSGPPPAPGDSAFRGREATAYRHGYHHGHMDGSRNLEENFERYHAEFEPEDREAFARGYQTGHEAGRRDAAAAPSENDQAWQNGYEAGQADAGNAFRPDHRRYAHQFNAASEASFRQGYDKGYHDARER